VNCASGCTVIAPNGNATPYPFTSVLDSSAESAT